MSSSLSKAAPPGSTPGPNPNTPQTPPPIANLPALAYCVQQLKQAMDSLCGFRGKNTDRAVTFNDLVDLQIASPSVIASSTGVTKLTEVVTALSSTVASNGTLEPNVVSTSYTLAATDVGKIVVYDGTSNGTLTVPSLATIGDNELIYMANASTSAVDIVFSAGTIEGIGGAVDFLAPGQTVGFTNDGTSWYKFLNQGVVMQLSGILVGGINNTVSQTSAPGFSSVIAGGSGNLISNATDNFIGGGTNNTIESTGPSFIGGGQSNLINGFAGVIAGGQTNTIDGGNSSNSGIFAGQNNHITSGGNSSNSAIVGGQHNFLEAEQSVTIGNYNSITAGVGNITVGNSITLSGTSAIGLGSCGNDRGNTNPILYGFQGPSSSKPPQMEDHCLWNSTSGASAVTLTTTGGAAAATNVAALTTNQAALFYCEILIVDQNTGNGNTYYMAAPGLIQQGASAATTTVGGATLTAGTAIGSGLTLQAAPTITADTSHGGFTISYTPPSANADTIYAEAFLHLRVIPT